MTVFEIYVVDETGESLLVHVSITAKKEYIENTYLGKKIKIVDWQLVVKSDDEEKVDEE